MALPATKAYDVDGFEKFITQVENRERYFELINGDIVEKSMPTEEHALIAGIFLGEFYVYAKAHNLGLPGPEARFKVNGDKCNTRQPDVSMILDPDAPITTQGASTLVPDAIVEVMSPDDNIDELRDKAKYYIANGARLVILTFPRQKIVDVYRPNVPTEILTIEDTLEGYDVLPGFVLPIASLFTKKRGG
ncbi:MAG: Uma2 family endonuclease [Chloroflexota bacterium]